MAGTKKSLQKPAQPESIPVDKIRRNPRNPRIEFKPGPMERLADSIEKTGVLVPLTVYRDSKDEAGTEFVLLDGERRWKAAKSINEKLVPAWVIQKPSGAENLQRMFNIHMLREPWGDIATTWALRDLMKETGVEDEKEVRRMTGLSVDTIRNMKRVLAFPKEWQERVSSGEVPFNLLIELDKAVLSRSRRPQTAKVFNKTEAQIREVFLEKYLSGSYRDVVDLRKVGILIDTAAGEGRVGKRAKKALRTLINDPKASIKDAFDVGAAASVDLGRVLNDMANLPDRLSDLAATDLDPKQRNVLRGALETLHKHLEEVIKKLGP